MFQVYQASSTTRSAPGGIKETKKTVCDSRSGMKKMAIGHHIGERAHIVEREKNVYTGDVEQREDLVNLDEGTAKLLNSFSYLVLFLYSLAIYLQRKLLYLIGNGSGGLVQLVLVL